MHADPAAVNVNFWVTPDEANEADAEHPGGLIVHRTYRGAEGDWNGIEHIDKMKRHLEELQPKGLPRRARQQKGGSQKRKAFRR